MTPQTAAAPTGRGVGIADSSYADRTQKLIKLVTELRALGAQTDIDLPRIAVIGNQSAGKSSLVEAITGITVPRASGTCTRCPMECRLTQSTEAWTCQILLRLEKDDNDGSRLSEVKEIKFGPLIHDKSLLEDMLRRAQLAILNPSIIASRFVDLDLNKLGPKELPLGSSRQLSFSENIVCLDISGPDVTNLSFIDLPGIISNVGHDEDRTNIDLIKNLVKDHIAGNTLILLTITMRDDIENQSAAFLAKQADPQGLRTIGVLTKPDTLQPGEHKSWLEILEGTRHPLKHGYFVTKQPSHEELEKGITFEVARTREHAFFNEGVWGTTSGKIRSRMGIPKLTAELSRLLSGLIDKTLPDLRKRASESLAETRRLYLELPPPPSDNPVGQLLDLVVKFSVSLEKHVDAPEGYEELIRKCRQIYLQLKIDLGSTVPHFIPFTKTERRIKKINGLLRLPAPGAESDGDDSERSGWRLTFEVEDDHVSRDDSHGYSMDINDVTSHVESSLTRQLPHNTPFSAKAQLLEKCFKDWENICLECFAMVSRLAKEHFSQHCGFAFNRHSDSILQEHAQRILAEQIDTASDDTIQRIKWLLQLESPPVTFNDHYYTACREKYLGQYGKARPGQATPFSFSRSSSPAPDPIENAIIALAQAGYNVSRADLAKLRPQDKYEEELVIMAEVQAYFRVAYKRVIDYVPRIIDHDFLRRIAKEIRPALTERLGLDSEKAHEKAKSYLREDASITEEREELKLKIDRLTEVNAKLLDFAS